MKFSSICLTLAAVLLGASILRADILILKNGEKKEGTILEERPDAVRMKYRITPKIWDEKDFPRADIQQIIKQKPEEIEIVELRKLLPTTDLLTADQYEQLIQDKLRPFINKYPGTKEATEAGEILATLQDEKQKVVDGQLKLEGQWLTADMVKRDDYNVQAYKMRRAILDKAAALDYIGALREFDRMSDPETGFPASIHYVKAIPEVLEILTKYESVLNRMISEQPVIQRQRDENLKRLVEPELSRTKAAIDQEINTWKATADAEKKQRIRWMSPYKYDAKSLQAMIKALVTERGTLQLIDIPRLTAQNEALTSALRFLADENVAEAEAALKKAQAIGTKDASRIITQIRSRITALKSELAKNKSASRAIGSGSSAVAGTTGAIQDDRVAKMLADVEEEKQKKKEQEQASGKGEPAKTEPGAASKTKPSSPKTAAPTTTATSQPAAEESGGIQKYLMIAAGVLLVVLVIALLTQKKTQKKEA